MAKNPLALLWAWIGPGDQDYARLSGTPDGADYRLLVSSKTVVSPPAPPAGSSPVIIDNSTPLILGQPLTQDVDYIIASGESFHLQFISAGSAGDPAEKGAMVEVYYYDGAAEHIIERVFVQSNTYSVSFDDVALTRDGIAMVGDGSTKKIILRRTQLSKAGELDSVVRGYSL